MFSYVGKKTVVTGAGRGIGRAVALAFAAQGADVVLAARTVEELESAADEISGLGRRAWVVPTDMGDLDQALELIDKAAGAMGVIDILVNNAGGVSHIPGGPGPIEQVTPQVFDAIYNLNFRSPFFASVKAAEHMKAHGGGSILNVASIDGLSPTPGRAVYASAKAALINMTNSMAVELGAHGIRVNAVAPSLIDTALGGIGSDEERLDEASLFPISRAGTPEDVAAAAVYLCSDEASWISGVTLRVAGGKQTDLDHVRWLRRVNPVPDDKRF